MDYAVIREALIENGFTVYCSMEENVGITGIRYWESQKCSFDPNMLYLIDENNVSGVSSDSSALVCMTDNIAPIAQKHAPNADILIPPVDVSPWQVIEDVWKIIRSHERWVQDLLRCALRAQSVSSFLSIATQKLRNPIAVFDQNFRIIARSAITAPLPKGTIWDNIQGEHFNMIEYYNARERSMIGRAMHENANHDILYHPARDPDHNYYSALLEVDGKPTGCIGVADVFAPLTPGQCALARTVRDMLEAYLKRNMRNLLLEDASSGFWFDLMTGKDVDTDHLREKLASRSWQADDAFIMVSFLPREAYYSQIELITTMNHVLMEFPRAIVAVEGEAVTLLQRIQDYSKSRDDKILSVAESINLCAGCSSEFSDLMYCGAAYRQSLFAANCAQKEGVKAVPFSRVHSDYILTLISKQEQPNACMDLRLLRLANSPKKNDRLLVPCLKAYLLNGRSIADTARALFLHRNTVIYRIEKLSRLLNVDFDSMSEVELFSLLISCFMCNY